MNPEVWQSNLKIERRGHEYAHPSAQVHRRCSQANWFVNTFTIHEKTKQRSPTRVATSTTSGRQYFVQPACSRAAMHWAACYAKTCTKETVIRWPHPMQTHSPSKHGVRLWRWWDQISLARVGCVQPQCRHHFRPDIITLGKCSVGGLANGLCTTINRRDHWRLLIVVAAG